MPSSTKGKTDENTRKIMGYLHQYMWWWQRSCLYGSVRLQMELDNCHSLMVLRIPICKQGFFFLKKVTFPEEVDNDLNMLKSTRQLIMQRKKVWLLNGQTWTIEWPSIVKHVHKLNELEHLLVNLERIGMVSYSWSKENLNKSHAVYTKKT